MTDWRFIVCLMLGASMGACTKEPVSTMGRADTTPPAVSFDGRYEGSIQISGVSSNVAQQQCATNQRLSLQVTNNAFTYHQTHTNVANLAPGLNPTYTANIAPNGLITGNSGDMGGTIQGTVSGTHMSGTITGLLCSYAFTADRV